MLGEYKKENLKGIIPRTFQYLFNKIADTQIEDNSINFRINFSYIQVYLEKIQDIFEPNNIVKIREDPERGIYLENCSRIKVNNIQDFKNSFKIAEQNRIKEFRYMNDQIRGRHVILIINIEKIYQQGKDNEYLEIKSTLNLVDLAGTERIDISNMPKKKLEETKKINSSLSVLGNCIQRLINNEYVPYRDSPLTKILKESFGGNAKTSLIVTISPSNLNIEETINSLNFGSRAIKVKNIPKINKVENYQKIVIKLREDYDKLMEKYTNLNINYEKVCEENEEYKSLLNQIDKSYEKKCKELEENFNKQKEENNKRMEECDLSIIEKAEKIESLNEELNEIKSKNQYLTEINEDLSKEIDELKRLNDESNSKILRLKTEENDKQNIYIKKINNQNIDSILNNLLKTVNKKTQKNYELKEENINLNKSLDEIKNNYQIMERDYYQLMKEKKNNEEKINQIKFENNELFNIRNNYIKQIQNGKIEKNELKKEIENYKNDLKNLEKEKIKLEKNIMILKNNYNKLIEMNEELKYKNQEIEIELFSKLKNIENNQKIINADKISEFENYKINNLNSNLDHSELERLKTTTNINGKLFNKSINLLMKDMSIFNNFHKEFKKMENIIQNDMPLIASNTYKYIINKALKQKNKIEEMLDNINYMNNSNIIILYKANSFDIKDNLNKLNNIMEENKKYMINLFILINKEFNKIIDLYKNIFEIKNNNNENEEKIKKNIIDIIMKSIDDFISLGFYSINNELKAELNVLKNVSNKLNVLDVLKNATSILEKALLKIKDYRNKKELEIQNLNLKIMYLLKEISNYK